MPFYYPFLPLPSRPDSLWVDSVLVDLSALHDAGAFDEIYLRRAWLTLMLVQIGDEPLRDDPALRAELVRWIVERSGLGEQAVEVPPTEDVFVAIGQDRESESSPFRASEEDPNVLHLVPGFSIAGRRWEFHLTDKDGNRPAPHGHDIEDHSVVLDPYTGTVIDKNGKALKAAKSKELRELWKDRSFRKFASRARATLKQQQPWRSDALPPEPTF